MYTELSTGVVFGEPSNVFVIIRMMATIYDVAKRAKVSTYTVSAVLNRSAYVSSELTNRVQQAVKDLDYTVNVLARGLQTRTTQTIGMLIPDIGNPFYAQVVRGVEDVLRKSGYSLILGNTYDDVDEQSRYLTVFRSRQVDGLLLFVAVGDQSEVEKLAAAKRPVVFLGRVPKGFEADCVAVNNVLGTRLAVEHLIAAGHRRIGIIAGHLSLSAGADRVQGWRQALRDARLKVDERYVLEGDWTAESGWRCANKLLVQKPRPTAVFAGNFLIMTGILRAMMERGLRCPQDLEVMSSDDSDWLDVFTPPISTVVQNSYEMGENAANLLLKRISRPNRKFEKIVLSPKLHLRSEKWRSADKVSAAR